MGKIKSCRRASADAPILRTTVFFGAYPDFTDSRFGGAYLEQRLLFGPSKTMPLLLSVGDKLVYAGITVPGHHFIIGPVKFKTPVRLIHCAEQPDIDHVF